MPGLQVLRARRQRGPAAGGFTLIESLVTIVILSIGVLALVILQLQTLADNRTAAMRNVATVLAYNLADQIRSNEAGKLALAYNLPQGALKTACYGTNGCSPSDIAVNGFQAWLDDAAAALPGGTGTICIDSTPQDGTPAAPACDNVAGSPYVVKIWWQEDKGATVQRFATSLVP